APRQPLHLRRRGLRWPRGSSASRRRSTADRQAPKRGATETARARLVAGLRCGGRATRDPGTAGGGVHRRWGRGVFRGRLPGFLALGSRRPPPRGAGNRAHAWRRPPTGGTRSGGGPGAGRRPAHPTRGRSPDDGRVREDRYHHHRRSLARRSGQAGRPAALRRRGRRRGAGVLPNARGTATLGSRGRRVKIDLNADVGEGFDDRALIPYLTSVNVACGGHAGDARTMADTVAVAVELGIAVGAHPSYPDRQHFGRRELALS